MSAITITLSDVQLEQLRTMAAQAGVTPEEMARTGLEEWLLRPREDFAAATAYVLWKNTDLYKRLA